MCVTTHARPNEFAQFAKCYVFVTYAITFIPGIAHAASLGEFYLLPRWLKPMLGTVKLLPRIIFVLLAGLGFGLPVRANVVTSARNSDGFLDFLTGLAGEVPDKYPLRLARTSFAEIPVGHARKDQSSRILVSGLARCNCGRSARGPNANIEVVVRGPNNAVTERVVTSCYLRSTAKGLPPTCHFAVFLPTTPPPGSTVEISCHPG